MPSTRSRTSLIRLASLLPGVFVWAAAAAEAPEGRLRLSGDGRSAWILSHEGHLRHVEIDSGRSLPSIGDLLRGAVDIGLSTDGEILYGLVPASGGKTTDLVEISVSTKEETGRWVSRGRGRFVEIAPDGFHACIVGLRPGGGRRRTEPKPEDWTLTVIDLKAGQTVGHLVVGLEPRALAILRGTDREPRLYIAGHDRVTTYSIAPARPARFFRSPGENLALTGMDGSSSLYLLRDSALVVIEPARWTRREGRVQLGDDDATSVVPLPAPGRAMGLTGDGSVALVLHQDGMTLSLVDTRAGHVIETRDLGEPRQHIAGPVMGDPRKLLLASSPAPDRSGRDLVESIHAPRISGPPQPAAGDTGETAQKAEQPEEIPEPPPREPDAKAPPQPAAGDTEETARKAEQPEEIPEPPPRDTDAEAPPRPAAHGTGETAEKAEAPAEIPEPQPREPDAKAPPRPAAHGTEETAEKAEAPTEIPEPQPREPDAETPPKAESEEIERSGVEADVPEPDLAEPGESGGPPARPVAIEAEPVAPATAPRAVLQGKLSGEFTATDHLLLFGPDNIMKLHAKADLRPDGTFSFPLPPPGRYRLIVSGGASRHLFTKPEFRAFVVAEGRGVEGLDFEVRGNL